MIKQLDFDGVTYEAPVDRQRLSKQLLGVRTIMSDGKWHTLNEMAGELGATPQSISARVRDLRKVKFGGHTVERRRIDGGLWEYRLWVSN